MREEEIWEYMPEKIPETSKVINFFDGKYTA